MSSDDLPTGEPKSSDEVEKAASPPYLDPHSAGATLASALLHHRLEPSYVSRILEVNGAAVFQPYTPRGKTVLMRAAECDSRFLQQLILALPPGSIDRTDNDGRTAVHYAAACGKADAVGMLLRAGASASTAAAAAAPGGRGDRPVHCAARRGSFAAVRQLVRHGADVQAVNDAGENALILGVREGHDVFVRGVLQLLPDDDARVRAVNEVGTRSSKVAAAEFPRQQLQKHDEQEVGRHEELRRQETPLLAACRGTSTLEVLWALISGGLVTTPPSEWFHAVHPSHYHRLKGWVTATLANHPPLAALSSSSSSSSSPVERNRRAILEDLAIRFESPPCSDDEVVDDGDCDY